MKRTLQTIALLTLTTLLFGCGQNENEALPDDSAQNNTEIATDNDVTDENEKEKQTDKAETSNNKITDTDFYEPFNGTLEHVHGLGYAGNQNAIYFAAHDGLKVYENGQWYKTVAENHDYMGFNAADAGFFASGHPAANSNLVNPFGIKRSLDNGQTLETLALEGVVDFHVMGVGYESQTIFVANPKANDLLEEAGELYVSDDLAENWEKIDAEGLSKDIINIAVHPTDSNKVAVAAKEGIYLSTNKGQSFELISDNMQGTSIYMSNKALWYGGYNGEPHLIKKSFDSETEEIITLPSMDEDAVMYFTTNPQNDNELAFITYNGNVFYSNNGAENWEMLVNEGKIQ
ncbi:F510_1955 family glycosylhydrolase [Cytobacillus sp. IB215316]|uniref:F510_1955 family glycosylhydrolase n=1 Tax=Cytobacillus sp. IB215316 TaxID=3097354 RepID=UPI002A0C92A0|nr:hypothetical protein [Cytobacillus sp. IB215316]MDX8361823.1 hypothetical protein [Cytobacillus sp. IB215316]